MKRIAFCFAASLLICACGREEFGPNEPPSALQKRASQFDQVIVRSFDTFDVCQTELLSGMFFQDVRLLKNDEYLLTIMSTYPPRGLAEQMIAVNKLKSLGLFETVLPYSEKR